MEYLNIQGLVELLLVDVEKMRELNLEFRGLNKSTDVLSFPLEIPGQKLLGSVVINVELATIEAKQRGHSLLAEITLLFVHGCLHLLGFDHEKDRGEQREKEEEVIRVFNLPASLIVRAQDF
ncbi:rRNA maturation RNase YbeY [Helicobacter suis]|uniref:rRNA maturation RNase YbeY n=1 Tax=Helicobacter suis TaxID=104628 RepID=UPI001F0745B2|nr:rRNA maturation RNase YbeY [Helicobacter suis]